jgi:cellulose synthase/poly-beta-1,6-N-acetylglucosamine synthase-like glycosyltransferase
MSLEFPLWLALGTVLYTYIGYPVALAGLRLLLDRPVKRSPIEPAVSIVIPAHNESRVIAAKIENTVTLDYPSEKIEVVVVSDGSTDGTAEVARTAIDRLDARGRVRVVEHEVNRGKVAVMNDVVPTLAGEIVVLTDAAAMFAPNAIRELVRSYADSEVGAAGGVYRVSAVQSAPTGAQEDFYWRYETFLKQQEASMGSVIGAHGAIYSVRKALYPHLPPETINDDFVIPVNVLQQGYRVAYDSEAIAYEEAHEMTGFERRIRVAAGNLEQLAEIRYFVRPFRPLELLYFVSHKLLRVVSPFAMLFAFVLNLFLLDQPAYRALFIIQGGFYFIAAIGASASLPRLLRLPYYFCMVNFAAFAAMYYTVLKRRVVAWH